MPIYRNDEYLDDISVAKIEFTSVPQPDECEAVIKVLGSIKDLNLGDYIKIGPTPVNNLGVMGKIVGRDDMDNILDVYGSYGNLTGHLAILSILEYLYRICFIAIVIWVIYDFVCIITNKFKDGSGKFLLK